MLANAEGIHKLGKVGRWRPLLCAATGVTVCAVIGWIIATGSRTARQPEGRSVGVEEGEASGSLTGPIEWGPHGVAPACAPDVGEGQRVNFAFLLLDEHPPELPSIPGRIAALAGRAVRIVGHAIPLEAVDGRTTVLILSRTRVGCCFGSVPRISEWIWVSLAPGESLEPVGEALVVVSGRFEVATTLNEVGDAVAYYRLEGARAERAR